MADLEKEFDKYLQSIHKHKKEFNDDEQEVIQAWMDKLRSGEVDDRSVRNEYAKYLTTQVNGTEKTLKFPFVLHPPQGNLARLADHLLEMQLDQPPSKEGQPSGSGCRRKPPPCGNSYQPDMTTKLFERTQLGLEEGINSFESPDEMARAIAQSKGMDVLGFITSISQYTSDNGAALRTALRVEMCAFKEYVHRVLSQRVKDLSEVLATEHIKEVQLIRNDYEKWMLEFKNCKERITEMVPNFDLESYKKDKNYLKKIFALDQCLGPLDDEFLDWRAENYHRLNWLNGQISILTEENDEISRETTELKTKSLDLEAREALKQQYLMQYNMELRTRVQELKIERDNLASEITELLLILEELSGKKPSALDTPTRQFARRTMYSSKIETTESLEKF